MQQTFNQYKTIFNKTGKKIRFYKDNCISCKKELWRKIDKVGKKCFNCAGKNRKGIFVKRNFNKCEVDICKNLTGNNSLCKYHRRRIKNLKKIQARNEVRKAILRRDLKKLSCGECNSSDTVAHHSNYDKPLEVEWLCVPHHKEAHGGKWLAIA